jgi:protein TonB
MKKLLLIMLTATFCGSLMAQSHRNVYSHRHKQKTTQITKQKAKISKKQNVEDVNNEFYVPAKFKLDSPTSTEEPDDKIYEAVEQMPTFKGGFGAFQMYLHNSINYPAEAKNNGIEGRVIVSFIVEKDGTITNAKVIRSIEPSLDAEALRIINNMQPWIPGVQNGKKVRVIYRAPITFRLNKN